MCIICASIPAAAAIGAKINVSQISLPEENRKPIGKITGMIIGLLVIASIIYHSLRWQG
jgi:hypothetical protein